MMEQGKVWGVLTLERWGRQNLFIVFQYQDMAIFQTNVFTRQFELKR